MTSNKTTASVETRGRGGTFCEVEAILPSPVFVFSLQPAGYLDISRHLLAPVSSVGRSVTVLYWYCVSHGTQTIAESGEGAGVKYRRWPV